VISSLACDLPSAQMDGAHGHGFSGSRVAGCLCCVDWVGVDRDSRCAHSYDLLTRFASGFGFVANGKTAARRRTGPPCLQGSTAGLRLLAFKQVAEAC
jgi:hypothetical protein